MQFTIEQILVSDAFLLARMAHAERKQGLSLHKNGFWFNPERTIPVREILRVNRRLARNHEREVIRCAKLLEARLLANYEISWRRIA